MARRSSSRRKSRSRNAPTCNGFSATINTLATFRPIYSPDGETERLVAEAWAAFGGIDVLVNNVGTYKEPPLAEITREHFDFIFRLNVWVRSR